MAQLSSEISLASDVRPAPGRIFGIVAIGDCLIGLDSTHIREAVPPPEEFCSLTFDRPGLLGAMMLRDETIPVVDLRHLLGRPPADRTCQGVVVVMRHDGRVLGLMGDDLCGMTTVTEATRCPIETVGDGPGELTDAVVAHPRGIVSLINTDRLFAHDGLTVSAERDPRLVQRSETAGQPYLLCGYGEQRFAFPALEIYATVPMTEVLKSPIAVGECDGVIRYHGREIPIVDTFQVFGTGKNFCRPERSAGALLRMPDETLLGFEVDRFYDLTRLPAETISALAPVVTSRREFLAGVHTDKDGHNYLIVNTETLRENRDLCDLALTVPREGSAGRKGSVAGTADHFLIYEAASRLASALTDIREIMPCPPQLLYPDVRPDGLAGTITHRGRMVPVFCLASLMGEYAFYEDTEARVLLTEREDRIYGFLVERVVSVERAERMPDTEGEDGGGDGKPGAGEVIRLRRNEDLITVFDVPRFLASHG